jgi:cyclopropane fatty-acyl-phospholipid synthase-like methyltransferase
MKNYDRYRNTTAQEYDKKTVMSWFCRIPSDKKILPLLSEIKNKKILEVGLGTGYYTRTLMQNNDVTGLDRNCHLCKLPVKLYEGDATEITRLLKDKKFDVVVSMWMTEYLDPGQLSNFFAESKKVLKPGGGKLVTTIISPYGFGFAYVTLAKKLRKIDKYYYRKKQIAENLRRAAFTDIKIINLDSWLWIPWAYLVIAQ